MNFIQYSKRFIHFAVFIICIFISTYQLVECLRKLRNPPVSSRYRFVINETLYYPAVTICRNPPFKLDVLKYYNLGNYNSDIGHNSEWQNFNFKNATIEEVWENATYTQEEIIRLYGLHGDKPNGEVIENFYYNYGRCFTFLPRVGSIYPWPNSGWSILLQHGRHDHNDQNNQNDSAKLKFGSVCENGNAGFHVYIHEMREPWTEHIVQTKYIMQYLYIENGEELEVKINADEFKGISTKNRPCLKDANYSRFQCLEQCRWKNITKKVGCTAPWIRGIDLPFCSAYEPLIQLINEYQAFDENQDPRCPFYACHTTNYKIFIVKRTPLIKPYSHLYVYYSSKMVTEMEELPGYDANTFLADLGGSLGFFLGLSVVGFMGLLEKTCNLIVCYAKPILKEGKEKKEMNNKIENINNKF